MKAPMIVDLMKIVAADVGTKMGLDINYMHGHPREVTGILTEMTQNPTASAGKYPLIALFQDFEEDHKGDFISLKLQLIIAVLTDRNLRAPERYTVSFKPFLYPIYDQLLRSISRSTFFNEKAETEIKHTKIDRLFWGRNGLYGSEKNIFNDYIDCIEINDLNLNVKPLNC